MATDPTRGLHAPDPAGAVPATATPSALRWLERAREHLARDAAPSAIADAERALAASPAAAVLRAALRVIYDAGDLERADRLARQYESRVAAPGPADRKLLARIHERAELMAMAGRPAAPRTLPVVPRRVVNVLAYSLPYVSTGYATRSHGLAQGVRDAGWEILPVTRPGFPFDQVPQLQGHDLPEEDVIDGLHYRRLLEPRRRGSGEIEYARQAVAAYRRVFEAACPALVHGASNHATSLPALAAARDCGIPFVYEMRGFWEVTRSSSEERFRGSATYRHIRLFETRVARCADHVITLTQGMRGDLVARGVPAERISVVPNAVDATRFAPRERDEKLAAQFGLPAGEPVIGYVGSFVDYEGLDDLVAAAARLAADGLRFRLLLVGDGLTLPAIRNLVQEHGLAGRTVFTGRVLHEEIGRHYSLVNVCPFPRKPWEVCELVSPLKPLEAMALSKSVIVSNVAALREMVVDGQTGVVCAAGDAAALADALRGLLVDPARRASIGNEARSWVERNRSWRSSGEACVEAYEAVMRGLRV